MDFSAALPTFLITLREGVEAALVVGIVLACLQKAQQSYLNSWVYSGVGVGIAASGLVGVLFSSLLQAVSNSDRPYTPVMKQLLEASFGVIAIAMLSWMLIWMTQQARFLKAEVEGAVTTALKQDSNAGWGVFTLIFIAVLREGFETVLFITAKFQQGLVPAFGALAGLVMAVVIGVLLFKLGVKINLRQFFQVMGIFLLLIVAGLVVSMVGHLDKAVNAYAEIEHNSQTLCFYSDRMAQTHSCILGPMVWNATNILPDTQFPGILLKTLFGYKDKLYLVQAVSYVLFLLGVGGFYLQNLAVASANKTQLPKAQS
ncbi:FTR1 family iron permease [Kamptonema animale CS-326]|jgi:high-affinity iron transporter|uniref:FTR1 family iron permease n=1 Tax=Kamptonema animale TaxID=92934 RepID=UPI00232AED43|nr:FTR1 family protein [Kamptonema animale]MDB9512666.1 FTR1 family iron permease [Kamptonema animale CS-326]